MLSQERLPNPRLRRPMIKYAELIVSHGLPLALVAIPPRQHNYAGPFLQGQERHHNVRQQHALNRSAPGRQGSNRIEGDFLKNLTDRPPACQWPVVRPVQKRRREDHVVR
eukprot:15374726-Alexandrium_andersonii.AAC.1